MADSTTNIDQISSGQASKEVTANAAFDAASPSMLFGRRASTTTALTWGFYGGKKAKSDGTIATIANGTIALTDNATNYLYATDAGVVTKATAAPSGWPAPLAASAVPLYQIVTSGGAVTSYNDYRTGGSGSGGSGGSAMLTTKGDLLTYDTASARLAVGTDGQVLTADSTQPKGVKWATPSLGSEAINAQTGTSYTIANSDAYKLLTHTNAAAIADTLPQAGSGGNFAAGWWVDVQNRGAGTLTITPTTSTIDGATSLAFTTGQGARIVSDGTNYFTQRGGAGVTSGGGSTTSITGTTGATGGNATATGGTSTTSGNVGGGVVVVGGTNSVSGNGGAVSLTGGQGNGASTTGGAVSIAGGDGAATGVTTNGGAVSITGGGSPNGYTAGSVTIAGGSTNGTAGGVTIRGGSTSSSTGSNGAVTVNGGDCATSSIAGSLTLRGGDGTGANTAGGAVTLRGGDAFTSNVLINNPGTVTIRGGNGGTSGRAAGAAVSITGGSGGTIDGAGGAVTVQGGAGSAANNVGGNVVLKGGAPAGTGNRGNVAVDNGGAIATTATGGFLCLPTCAGAPTGTPANVPSGSVAVVFDTTNLKLYAYLGGAWKSTAAFT